MLFLKASFGKFVSQVEKFTLAWIRRGSIERSAAIWQLPIDMQYGYPNLFHQLKPFCCHCPTSLRGPENCQSHSRSCMFKTSVYSDVGISSMSSFRFMLWVNLTQSQSCNSNMYCVHSIFFLRNLWKLVNRNFINLEIQAVSERQIEHSESSSELHSWNTIIHMWLVQHTASTTSRASN